MIILGFNDSVPQYETIRRSDAVQTALERENRKHQDSQLSCHCRVESERVSHWREHRQGSLRSRKDLPLNSGG